ncbi:hypothetical protein ACV3J7_20810 [Salmonella enterica]
MTKQEFETLQTVYQFLENCESVEQARFEIERYVAKAVYTDVAMSEVERIGIALFYPELVEA